MVEVLRASVTFFAVIALFMDLAVADITKVDISFFILLALVQDHIVDRIRTSHRTIVVAY